MQLQFRDKIKLSLRYGSNVLIVGGVYNVWYSFRGFLLDNFVSIWNSLLLKIVVMFVVFYFDKKRRTKDTVYFYINLGLSPRRMSISVLMIDFLSFLVLFISAYLAWIPLHS